VSRLPARKPFSPAPTSATPIPRVLLLSTNVVAVLLPETSVDPYWMVAVSVVPSQVTMTSVGTLS
jgi:hypothetical protein